MDFTHIAPHGAGWFKANPSVLGGGLWVKTTDNGITLPDEAIPGLVVFLQAYMSMRARKDGRRDAPPS